MSLSDVDGETTNEKHFTVDRCLLLSVWRMLLWSIT